MSETTDLIEDLNICLTTIYFFSPDSEAD